MLYHLRHPLLALDNVKAVTRGQAYIETAVCDYETDACGELPIARFYPRDELAGDGSNWFAPNVAALKAWCRSCGLEPGALRTWPEGQPNRAMLAAQAIDGIPEYQQFSYERPLRCSSSSATSDARRGAQRGRLARSDGTPRYSFSAANRPSERDRCDTRSASIGTSRTG